MDTEEQTDALTLQDPKIEGDAKNGHSTDAIKQESGILKHTFTYIRRSSLN